MIFFFLFGKSVCLKASCLLQLEKTKGKQLYVAHFAGSTHSTELFVLYSFCS
jgi:hypothetical protein